MPLLLVENCSHVPSRLISHILNHVFGFVPLRRFWRYSARNSYIPAILPSVGEVARYDLSQRRRRRVTVRINPEGGPIVYQEMVKHE